MKSHLTNLIKAGYGCAYCVTHEEQRVFGELLTVAKSLDYDVWQWSITDGLVRPTGKKEDKTQDPLAVLGKFMDVSHTDDGPEGNLIKNKSLLVLKDYHAFLRGNPPPMLTRALKEAIGMARSTNRPIVIIGCQLHLPPELEKEVMPVEFSLPPREELKVVAVEIAASAKQELNGNSEAILDAAAGLTTTEFADAAAYSVAEKKEIEPGIINRIKAETIKKGGILEVINPGVTFEDLGGLQELKAWITKRKNAFTKKAREYGLPMLKGVCLYGVQGAGKSYATRAIASELDCPLLRLDAGKLFGGLVGSSEANVRAVIAQVEAFGKCCLQIDEIDKGFAGMAGGHDGDSGTTRRVIGTFLTWMQDKTSPVFIIATANDLTKLPPELLRKGRWDELFFIDLPTVDERVEIWRVQIRKHGRKPDGFSLKALAQATEGWTGAEIEALFKESLFAAFEHDEEPDDVLLLELRHNTVPLSKTMAEPIKALRDWSQGRARSASAPVETKTVTMKRKIA
jgi:ATPases of the AAA+ class